MQTTLADPRSLGRGKLWLGLGLVIAGIVAFFVQFSTARLFAPWYLPLIVTTGALFCVAALWERRSIWRILTVLFVVLLAGGTWAFMLLLRLPAYNGPAIVGQQIPAFATLNADGQAFTHEDLKGDRNTVLVFFRGRW